MFLVLCKVATRFRFLFFCVCWSDAAATNVMLRTFGDFDDDDDDNKMTKSRESRKKEKKKTRKKHVKQYINYIYTQSAL